MTAVTAQSALRIHLRRRNAFRGQKRIEVRALIRQLLAVAKEG